MLQVSSRPVDPRKIDPEERERSREFKDETDKKALAGNFDSTEGRRQALARDLMNHVRTLKATWRRKTTDKLDDAARPTNLIQAHRAHTITPEAFHKYGELVGRRRRSKAAAVDQLRPGDVGSNGYRVGYTHDGDKVEWLQSDDPEGPEDWPVTLRRGDTVMLAAHKESWDKVGTGVTCSGTTASSAAKRHWRKR